MSRDLPVLLCCGLALASGATALPLGQDPAAPAAQDPDAQEPRATLEDLRARLDAMEARHADEVDDLSFEIEGLHEKIAQLDAQGRSTPRSAGIFNPAVTVFGNFVARADDRSVYLDDDAGEERIDDQFNLREVEVDFRAAIDPWSDGVLIAAYESEVPGESSAAIEEGYVTLRKLPWLDTAPAGLKLQAGRFRPGFGRFNQIHLHDLPQPSYPRSLAMFLGEEGYVRDGVSGKFFLPSPAESQTLESTVAVLNGGGLPVAEEESRSNLAVLGHVEWFNDLGAGKNLELGLSGLQTDSDHRLWGADATFKWKPHGGGEWNSFLVGAELFQADVDEEGLSDHPLGFYVWTQYQLDRNLYVGARYDRTEELEDASLVTDTFGAYVTFYTTEFLRLRLALEHAESDVDLIDGRDTALFELNFIFGSHPVEPYWVNR